MEIEKSCGCIIIKDDKVLLICARDDDGKLFWSFPKGHQEDGESDIETAIRETREETGLDVNIVDNSPIITGHFISGGSVYKKILLFRAAPLNDDFRPQEDEVEEIQWITINEADHFLTGYYLDAWRNCLNRFR